MEAVTAQLLADAECDPSPVGSGTETPEQWLEPPDTVYANIDAILVKLAEVMEMI